MELVLNSTRPGNDYRFTFSPHLLPVNKGILSTIYIAVEDGVTEADLRALYAARNTGTNLSCTCCRRANFPRCAMLSTRIAAPYFPDARPPGKNGSDYIVICTEDNLIKGASGQALQDFNI